MSSFDVLPGVHVLDWLQGQYPHGLDLALVAIGDDDYVQEVFQQQDELQGHRVQQQLRKVHGRTEPPAAPPQQHCVHQDPGHGDHDHDQELDDRCEARDEQLVLANALQHAVHVRHRRRDPDEAVREHRDPLHVVGYREGPYEEHRSEEAGLRQRHGTNLVLQVAIERVKTATVKV
eukprot:CAMPEP_0197924346 /NCGR_PEP_ID=MMETSP1439-20131203/95536_1 /TAXON_ID=66791 /ORGANISM="Gonyaulax spinifera, Strain CCMP409" /LENGTH=175 /DNA_ID=CAMNT_0043546763 /DNA_START=249 /DNA_END=777 /DNA_ORIENTATION=+